MNELFINYELALELKQLGFDEPCFGWYDSQYQGIITYDNATNSCGWLNGTHCSAPTFSQAFRWFRKKYKLHNGIYPYYDEYEYQIKDFNSDKNNPINGGLMKYEDAEISCLIRLIEIIKK